MVADSTINSARHNDSIHTNEGGANQTNIRVLKSNAKMPNGQPHPHYQQGTSTTPRAELGGRAFQVPIYQAPHRQLIEVNNHAGGEGGGGQQRLDSRGTSKFASQEDIIGVSRSFESPWNLGAKIRSSGKQRESRNGTPEVPLGLQTRQAPLATNNFGRLQQHT